MLRRWGWFAALAPLGAASAVYVVIIRGFVADGNADGIVWPLLGILPLFVFGIWLLTVSTSRSALFIAGTATAIAVGAAFETFVGANPDVVGESWFPRCQRGRADRRPVASRAFISMFATYPTGVPERRWQRIAVGLLWVPSWSRRCRVRHAVRADAGGHHDRRRIDAEPVRRAVARVGGARGGVDRLQAWPAVFLGLAVLISRAFFGDVAVRARIRVMTWLGPRAHRRLAALAATHHWLWSSRSRCSAS